MYMIATFIVSFLGANKSIFTAGLSHGGRKFIFNSEVGYGHEGSSIMVVGMKEEPVININISHPDCSSTVPIQFVTISSYDDFEITRPPDVPSYCAIMVMSDRPVTLTLVLRRSTSVETTLILPIQALGMDYSVSAGHPGQNGLSRVGITATVNLTIVLFVVPHGVSIRHNGDVYTGGQLIYIYPPVYITTFLECQGDLTGAHILSSQPVVVSSGTVGFENKRTTENQPESVFTTALDAPTTDSTSIDEQQEMFLSLEMIPPKEVWGKTFICFPLPHTNTSYSVLSGSYSMVVTLHGDLTETVSLNATGDYFTRHIEEPIYITTSHPALLTIYALPFSSGGMQTWPSMMTEPPVEQWLRFYSFFTPILESFYHRIIIIVNRNYTTTFLVDFKKLTSDWRMVLDSDYAVTSVSMSEGHHHVYNDADGVKFGLVAYGMDFSGRSYAHPTGMNLAKLYESCENTPNVNDDGDDNDCDGVVDEELDNQVDDDGDGLVDEDCFTVYRPLYTFSSPITPSVSQNTFQLSNQINLSLTLLCLFLGPLISGIVLTFLYLGFLRLRSKTKITLVDNVNPVRKTRNNDKSVSTPRLIRVRTKLENV